MPTFCYLKFLKAKKLSTVLKHYFFLFPDRRWSPGPQGQMFRCFLAILSEAIMREGLPPPCILQTAQPAGPHPKSYFFPRWPWWLRMAGRMLTVRSFLALQRYPMGLLENKEDAAAPGALSLVLNCIFPGGTSQSSFPSWEPFKTRPIWM